MTQRRWFSVGWLLLGATIGAAGATLLDGGSLWPPVIYGLGIFVGMKIKSNQILDEIDKVRPA